jgi:iron complex outermembrane recepter protein
MTMSGEGLALKMHLWIVFSLVAGGISIIGVPSSGAAEIANIQPSATTLKEWLGDSVRRSSLITQGIAPLQITKVRLNPTNESIEVILETDSGKTLQLATTKEGNTVIAEISNVVLALPEKQDFRAINPTLGIKAEL